MYCPVQQNGVVRRYNHTKHMHCKKYAMIHSSTSRKGCRCALVLVEAGRGHQRTCGAQVAARLCCCCCCVMALRAHWAARHSEASELWACARVFASAQQGGSEPLYLRAVFKGRVADCLSCDGGVCLQVGSHGLQGSKNSAALFVSSRTFLHKHTHTYWNVKFPWVCRRLLLATHGLEARVLADEEAVEASVDDCEDAHQPGDPVAQSQAQRTNAVHIMWVSEWCGMAHWWWW